MIFLIFFLLKKIFKKKKKTYLMKYWNLFKQLNMPLLYLIFIIKTKVNPNFDIINIDDKKFKENTKEIFKWYVYPSINYT